KRSACPATPGQHGTLMVGGPPWPSIAPEVSQALDELVRLLLGLLLRVAVALLEQADELVFLAGNPVPVVVGELGPLRLELALEFLPSAFEHVPIHRTCPLECGVLSAVFASAPKACSARTTSA